MLPDARDLYLHSSRSTV